MHRIPTILRHQIFQVSPCLFNGLDILSSFTVRSYRLHLDIMTLLGHYVFPRYLTLEKADQLTRMGTTAIDSEASLLVALPSEIQSLIIENVSISSKKVRNRLKN